MTYLAKTGGAENDQMFQIIYTGPSMNPLFKAGDRLEISPYAKEKIRTGDVIAFTPPEKNKTVIHRVCASGPAGIQTQGDDNRNIDPWILHPGQIQGRVISVFRKKERKVLGGFRGRVVVFFLRGRKTADSWISGLLRPFYHFLISVNPARFWPFCRLKIRLVSFHKSAGTELHLRLGNRLIGRRLLDKERWQIKRPFRLLLNEAVLAGKPSTCKRNPRSSEPG